MSLPLELPDDLTAALETEATRLGLSLPDYAARLLASASLKPLQVHNGAELVAYWRAEGIVGSRSGEEESSEHARALRHKAERREG